MRKTRGGFTMVELLVVVTVLAVLASLLLPAIFGARKKARKAQAGAQANNLATALASFKSRMGSYPPSRMVVHESGHLGTPPTNNRYFDSFAHETEYNPIGGTPFGPAAGSEEFRDVAYRSLRALRSIFPKMRLDDRDFNSAGNSLAPTETGGFYDFNGDGSFQQEPIMVEGHECLALFLSGVPIWDAGFLRGMGGLHKNPRNPFQAVPPDRGGEGRNTPFYEVANPEALSDDDADGIPGILDPLGEGADGRYVAYFSSSFGGYDPRDIVFPDEPSGTFTIPGLGEVAVPGPNPWTTGTPSPGSVTRYLRPQTFQLISPGIDREYGPGGEPSEGDDNIGNRP